MRNVVKFHIREREYVKMRSHILGNPRGFPGQCHTSLIGLHKRRSGVVWRRLRWRNFPKYLIFYIIKVIHACIFICVTLLFAACMWPLEDYNIKKILYGKVANGSWRCILINIHYLIVMHATEFKNCAICGGFWACVYLNPLWIKLYNNTSFSTFEKHKKFNVNIVFHCVISIFKNGEMRAFAKRNIFCKKRE